jgi:hypothetical protein
MVGFFGREPSPMLEDPQFSTRTPSPFHLAASCQDVEVLDKELSGLDEQHLGLQH